jgi:NADH:ubiquinone oxidoreductase subunit C
MSQEDTIKQELMNKFGLPETAFRIPRERRIFLETSPESFPSVFEYAVRELKFCHLCTITGLDEADKLSFIYHLAQDRSIMLNIKTSVPKDNPKIRTVTSIFPSADPYERELVDLLGAQVEGLPAGNRYPLTDDWPKDQFPLRKDWKVPATNGQEGKTDE